MDKENKKQNAITLIALVITVIVLLILVGVALSLVIGEEGMIWRAISATKIHSIAEAKDKFEIDVANYASDFYQAIYLNGDSSETSKRAYILGKISTGQDYKVDQKDEETGKVRISISDGTNATGTIDENGSVIWDEILTEPKLDIAKLMEDDVEINYEPNGTYDWLGKYATSYAETVEDEKTIIKNGTTYYTNIKLKTGNPTIPTTPAYDTVQDMSIKKWKILKTEGNKVYLVPSKNAAATPNVSLHGAQGYNNAVNLLDEACSALYGNAEKGISAESIDMDLIEGLLKKEEDKITDDANKKWLKVKTDIGYKTQIADAYSIENSNYPLIYPNEQLSVIGNTSKGNTGLGMSDPYKENNIKKMIERNTGTLKIGAVDGTGNTILQPYQTHYYMSNSVLSTALGSYSSLILPNDGSTNYWVASRCIDTKNEENVNNCLFYVRIVSNGGLSAYFLFESNGGEGLRSRSLFPVVSLSSELIKKDESGKYYVDVQ